MGERITMLAGSEPISGYVAVPESGAGPGVLVLHAWWGLTEPFTSVCDRLAAEGFVAVAPDLHAGQTAATISEAEALLEPNHANRGAAALAGLEYLMRHSARTGDRVGTIGFSLGAAWAIELASDRPEAIAAVVIFYGTNSADFNVSRAAYLGHFAEGDEWEPDEMVEGLEGSLRAAGRAVDFYVYPKQRHWFFEPNRPEYDPDTAKLAWERTLAFLQQHLVETPEREAGL